MITKTVQIKKNMFKKVMVEEPNEFDVKNGLKREAIFNAVGKEYTQINILATVLAEIVSTIPELQSNQVILDAMAKFKTVNDIRNG